MLLSSMPALAAAPGNVFDFSHWILQLPTGLSGHPTEISGPRLVEYSDEYFQLAPDNSIAFFAPNNGTQFKGSTHPRTELKETTADGVTTAAWDPFDDGKHALAAELKVTVAPSKLCIGQIHIGSVLRGIHQATTKPLMELYYDTNGDIIVGGNRDPFDASGRQVPTRIGNIKLDTKFCYQITASTGTLTVVLNGISHSWPIPTSFQDYGEYFKVGDYNQTNSYGSGTIGTRVNFYAISVEH
ncbi:MAG: alginate lyase [Rhodocyclales bacterium]|nr:alginate lyase [Rhodocyclales bacterium]